VERYLIESRKRKLSSCCARFEALGRVDLGHSSPRKGNYPELDYTVLDNPHQPAELPINKTNSNAIAHIVRGRIRTEIHDAMNLPGGNAPFAGQH
jgi:hypothetical protein